MKQETPFWKISTLIVAILGIASSFYFHYDTQRSTEKKIVEALSERYVTVDKEMTYEKALEAVDRDIEKLKNDNTSLQSKNNDLEHDLSSLKKSNERSEKIALAESYAALGNYGVAIPILDNITEKTEDVTALLENYITNYEISIITEAESLADSGDFDKGVALIDEALKTVPKSQVLIDKKDNITPKYLVDTIDCYKAENLRILDSKDYMKMSGKSYRHAIYSELSDPVASMFNSSYSANAFFNLDGEYNQLSLVIGHMDFSGSGTIGKSDGGQIYDAEITIWGDDKEISTITLLSNDNAKKIDVSIAEVKILEFQIECSGNSKVGIAELQIR